MKCPNCGGNVEGNVCPYCDTHFEPPEEKNTSSKEYRPFDYSNASYLYSGEKWYTKTWVVILFLIFFFPVGLYLMWRYKDWGTTAKIVVTVVIALIAIFSMF